MIWWFWFSFALRIGDLWVDGVVLVLTELAVVVGLVDFWWCSCLLCVLIVLWAYFGLVWLLIGGWVCFDFHIWRVISFVVYCWFVLL